MPSAVRISALLRNAGVSRRSRLVLYPAAFGFVQIARVWMVLDTLGLGAQSSILAGGVTEIRPPALASATSLDLQYCGQRLANLQFVLAHQNRRHVVLVDARARFLFLGVAIEGQGERAGHIPGAINLPYTRLLGGGRLLARAALRGRFLQAGVRPGDALIVYCHSGQKAGVVYLAARLLGYDVRLFPGSWQEWSRHQELPAATGP
ncbi:MAG: sulfurtransferase [Terriglobales bacterium]